MAGIRPIARQFSRGPRMRRIDIHSRQLNDLMLVLRRPVELAAQSGHSPSSALRYGIDQLGSQASYALKKPELRFAMEWVVLLVVILILGALAGGNSLGETIRNGLGSLVLIVLVLLALAFIVAGNQG